MVTRELIQWLYVWKTQKWFFCIPFAVVLMILLAATNAQQLAKDITVFLLYPSLVFPIVGLCTQIGAHHQKEILITFPMSPWINGALRPILLSLGYGLLYGTIIMKYYGETYFFPSFISVLLFMLMTTMFIALFKNSAFGLCTSLIILFFGLFTGGSGIGALFLMQWFRPIPGSLPDRYVLEQTFLCLVFLWITVNLLAYRDRFHIIKE